MLFITWHKDCVDPLNLITIIHPSLSAPPSGISKKKYNCCSRMIFILQLSLKKICYLFKFQSSIFCSWNKASLLIIKSGLNPPKTVWKFTKPNRDLFLLSNPHIFLFIQIIFVSAVSVGIGTAQSYFRSIISPLEYCRRIVKFQTPDCCSNVVEAEF